jgi:hypothetical protein
MTSIRLREMPSAKQYLAKNAEFVSTVWYQLAGNDNRLAKYLAAQDLVSDNETGGRGDFPLEDGRHG